MHDNHFNGVFSVVKGVFIALASVLLLTVVFACVLRAGNLASASIYPVNQGIKAVSVALGVFLSVRGEKGWLKGSGIGLGFTMLSYLVFSSLGGDFSLSWLLFLELFLGVFSGALCGIIAVSVRRN